MRRLNIKCFKDIHCSYNQSGNCNILTLYLGTMLVTCPVAEAKYQTKETEGRKVYLVSQFTVHSIIVRKTRQELNNVTASPVRKQRRMLALSSLSSLHTIRNPGPWASVIHPLSEWDFPALLSLSGNTTKSTYKGWLLFQ